MNAFNYWTFLFSVFSRNYFNIKTRSISIMNNLLLYAGCGILVALGLYFLYTKVMQNQQEIEQYKMLNAVLMQQVNKMNKKSGLGGTNEPVNSSVKMPQGIRVHTRPGSNPAKSKKI